MNLRFFLICLSLLLLIGLGIIGWSAYRYYVIIHSDDPISPIFEVHMGAGTIVRGDLAIKLNGGESYPLKEEDIIETGLQSKATIIWPDRSLTRLGPETRIKIKRMMASRDYQNIEISYDMERGKVWNNVIRMILGDSYFRVNIPKQNIVAGVRGTIFEVNLDGGYIRAVSHTTELRDIIGRQTLLFPGDVVSSEDVSKKINKEFVDAAWNEWNVITDSVYETTRAAEIESRVSKLAESVENRIGVDTLTREVLKKIDGFEALSIAESFGRSGTLEYIESTAPEPLLEYYQKFSSPKLPDVRSKIRQEILKKIEENPNYTPIKKLLESQALWESFDLGEVSPEVSLILEKAGIIIENGIEDIQGVLDPQIYIDAYSGALRRFLD